MAYASSPDVQALISTRTTDLTINDTSNPTEDTVNGWCDEWSSVLDGIMNGIGYGTVPATDSSDMLMLRPYVAMRVAYDTWTTHFPAAQTQPQHVNQWLTAWDRFVDMLTSGRTQLPSQSPTAFTFGVSAPRVYGT